jgi:hypothetical protein
MSIEMLGLGSKFEFSKDGIDYEATITDVSYDIVQRVPEKDFEGNINRFVVIHRDEECNDEKRDIKLPEGYPLDVSMKSISLIAKKIKRRYFLCCRNNGILCFEKHNDKYDACSWKSAKVPEWDSNNITIGNGWIPHDGHHESPVSDWIEIEYFFYDACCVRRQRKDRAKNIYWKGVVFYRLVGGQIIC